MKPTNPNAAYPWDLYSGKQRWVFLAVLFLVSTSNVVDRQIVTVLLEPIKAEFGVSDTMLGLLSGLAFALFYVTLGLPIARLADSKNRKVIIGAAITVWSLMTVLCGVAQSFFQLALARVGVGAGEAGAVPPSQSLLADYFPPERRSLALAVFFMSAAAGNVLGLIVGGQIADAYGWRWTFVIFGLPGLLLALLVWFVLDEPRNLPKFKVETKDTESFREALAILKKKPAFVNSVIGMVLYYTMIYGVLTFSISFVIRTQGLSLADASAYYGAIGLIAAIIGNPFGGWLADKLSKSNTAWLGRLPGYGFLLAFPLFLTSYLTGSLTVLLVFLALGMFVMMMATPPIFSCLHAVCGTARRATAIAIAYFFANLIGVGLGPVITGVLSDYFAASIGPAEGLRYALAVMTVLYLPSAFFMLRAARTLEQDSEE
ncbi:MFS transporter [Pseudophaeobacter sp.]|jgi:predicted MFS family arabinose efflux permease|uniref:spinster family MFS transporter n=1 Tax=Pseudophaeobacter sp. TaxID=1971739 RepID=UPI002604D44D|nr:MFS transporter [Pseudophaeobacter sp.]